MVKLVITSSETHARELVKKSLRSGSGNTIRLQLSRNIGISRNAGEL